MAGSTQHKVQGIAFDSREVAKDFVFVAVSGTRQDGHNYIEQAIDQGAIAVVCENMPDNMRQNITYIGVHDSTEALGIMASNFYDNPASKLKLVAVTGTNGKTTCVSLLFDLFRKLGYNTGLLSTIQNQINNELLDATLTTPDAISLNRILYRMVERGCTHCFMEASSHAIVQKRIAGLQFAGAVFTNISHDHLDYHKTFENYINAKKKLFDALNTTAFALANVDDKRGLVMLQNTKAVKKTFALRTHADFNAKVLSNTLHGLEIEINNKPVWFQLNGRFNAYNILAVYATAYMLGEDKDKVLTVLSALKPAKGRFEKIISKKGIVGIVDYAHTPDALQNVLETIKEIRTRNEKLITIVGCGGNRDKEKRPLMGKVATNYSDLVILTSDNPRDEEPEAIINDMKKGVEPLDFKKVFTIPERSEAIQEACSKAGKGDIILIAGKGHENYQEVKGKRHHFDDMELLIENFKITEA